MSAMQCWRNGPMCGRLKRVMRSTSKRRTRLPARAVRICNRFIEYNNRPGPNHRYITDRALRAAMEAAGWVREDYGPDAVIMCTPK